MANEEYFWELWNKKGKSTLKLFNMMLKHKHFERIFLMAFRYNKSGYHLIKLYEKYKKFNLLNIESCLNSEEENIEDLNVNEEVKDFVEEMRKNNPELVKWLNSLGND